MRVREERACRRTGERNSTEACLPRRTRCKGARTRRRHAFSTGPTVVRDRTTSTATTKTTMRTRTRMTATISVLSCHPCPVRYGDAASVPLERLTMPGTTRVSFLPSCATPPPRGTIVPRPRFLTAPVLLRATHHLAGDTMLTDGSRPTYHRHPHVQNPASGVNVPEFPRVSLLNMHLLRAPGRAGVETAGWERVGRAVQRDSFYLSRCSRLECGMTVFAIT